MKILDGDTTLRVVVTLMTNTLANGLGLFLIWILH